jgi:hypothetical protein
VRVQALDTFSRAADAAARTWPTVRRWHCGIAFVGVPSVGCGDVAGRYGGLGEDDAAVRFETSHHRRFDRTDEPVARRHRRAVIEKWMVADHDGVAVAPSDDDLVAADRSPAE